MERKIQATIHILISRDIAEEGYGEEGTGGGD